jgi:hypothetical protein
MSGLRRAAAMLFVWGAACAALPAHAESLRCNGSIASEGDSRLSVLYKCGPPLLRDTTCAPVVYVQTLNPVPDPFATAFVPCQAVEEWLYERGPGEMTVTVRFRAGVVQAITYGQRARER